MNKYELEESTDKSRLLIRANNQIYVAGYDRAIAEALVKKLNEAHRPNLESREDGLYVCWNEHSKSEGCSFVIEIENNNNGDRVQVLE